MGITLSYGYVKPVTGDRGSTAFFTPMENNIQRINDHTHNGTDSAPLPAQSIVGVPQNILAVNWVSYGGPTGFYRQLVTLAPGFSYDTVQIQFRLSSGHYIYPTIEKVSATQYYIYTIDNTLDLIAVYGG